METAQNLKAKLELKKKQLMSKTLNATKRYGYCIYLDNELYSRFQNAHKRAEHLRTMFFETASYQKEVRLLYFKDPPERIPPIREDIKRLICKAKLKDEANLQDTAS